MNALITHLLQSTLFAALMGGLAWICRNNRAGVRYHLWLAASLKFLVPFSLLVGLGAQLQWRPLAVISSMALPVTVNDGAAVIAPAPVQAPPAAQSTLPAALFILWLIGCSLHLLAWFRQWRSMYRASKAASPLPVDAPIPVLATESALEPGVFGILRPVLLIPSAISGRLTPGQFRAIILHEICHVRRRDNLTAALHMTVESLFWFYPLLRFIRTRLVEERERACDEQVIAETNAPETYAEGILTVCRLYVASPLLCASGVTGSNLKRRIEEILTARSAARLNGARKLLLAAAAVSALALPLFTGMMYAPRLRAQSASTDGPAFEVASVRLNREGGRPAMEWSVLPGGRLSIKGFPLRGMISAAYRVPLQSFRLTGGPDWLRSEFYDVEATPPAGTIPAGLRGEQLEARVYPMLQSLLRERFKLVIRREQRELPVYAVVLGKGGPKLQRVNIQEADCAESKIPCHLISGGQGRGIHAKAVSLLDIVSFVENWTDRPMVDKTGLDGLYEVDTEGWIPVTGPVNLGANEGASDGLRPTLGAVFDRLGLKMESQKAVVEMFIIDHVERPIGN